MSKLIIDLVNEFESLDEIEDDFELFIMSIKIDEFGEYDSAEIILPVSHIEVDSEKEECLFHFDSDKSDDKAISIEKVLETIKTIDSNVMLCSAEDKTKGGELITLDNPIIGFGENIEQKRFFLVFQTYELH